MKRATLPPDIASRTQRVFTVKHQISPRLRYFVSRFRLFVIDKLPVVGDDATVLVDGLEREHAPPMKW